jgi:uncharacterized repeat protein (TIGR03803 family)
MGNRTTTNRLIHSLGLTLAILISGSIASAQSKFSVLHHFRGGNDGANPLATLVVDKSGALFGTTSSAGAQAHGTVFRMTRLSGGAWTETVLSPAGGNELLLDSSGNLYGTGAGPGGGAVAFKLTRSQSGHWSEKVLYSFGNGSHAVSPNGALIMDKVGSLYGAGLGGSSGFGAVFKLTLLAGVWKETTLLNLNVDQQGYKPNGVIMDKTGSLYGTSEIGGGAGAGAGVAFTLTHTGGKWTATNMHGFAPGGDGQRPRSALLLQPDGALYGTTSSGGAFGTGTVYKLTPTGDSTWTETLLYSFTVGKGGSGPYAELVADQTGALYGTTVAGGDSNQGVVFKLTPQSGGYVESVLHSFTGASDGGVPYGGLVFGKDGALYGTTSVGGRSNQGVVFRLK